MAMQPAPSVNPADGDFPAPENLQQEYEALRERHLRTTNALASAAHDLKTRLIATTPLMAIYPLAPYLNDVRKAPDIAESAGEPTK